MFAVGKPCRECAGIMERGKLIVSAPLSEIRSQVQNNRLLRVQVLSDVQTAIAIISQHPAIKRRGLIKGARHPEEAKAFYEWALTPEAQALAAANNSYQLPSNPATPRPARRRSPSTSRACTSSASAAPA